MTTNDSDFYIASTYLYESVGREGRGLLQHRGRAAVGASYLYIIRTVQLHCLGVFVFRDLPQSLHPFRFLIIPLRNPLSYYGVLGLSHPWSGCEVRSNTDTHFRVGFVSPTGIIHNHHKQGGAQPA